MFKARKFSVAAEWARILTDEFSNQGNMEKELNIPTQLFGGPPERDSIIKMGESQIGFMNIFARPLFEAVTDILPAMRFSVNELIDNKATWEQRIEDEKLGCPDHHTAENGLCTCRAAKHDDLASPLTQSRTELPLTNNGTLTPPIRLLPTTETQENQSRRGSGDASVTAFIYTENTPNSPVDSHHRKRTSSFNPFNNTRLRSASPTKRKSKGRSSSQKAEPDRPRTSPSSPSANILHDPPPVPKQQIDPRSQPDMRCAQPNGTLDTKSMPGPKEKNNQYLTSVISNSDTEISKENPKLKGKFPWSKLWKRRWRQGVVMASSPPVIQNADERVEEVGDMIEKE